jgi:hypothetical protein
MKVTAVTVAREELAPPQFAFDNNINWFLFAEDSKIPDLDMDEYKKLHADYSRGSRVSDGAMRYVQYLAKKRNRAFEIAIETYPQTDTLILCDRYYLRQTRPFNHLLHDYLSLKQKVALGGAIWGTIKITVKDWITLRGVEWYDKWAVPELRWCPYGWMPDGEDAVTRMMVPPLEGLYRVSSLGGISIFPRTVWDDGVRFNVPSDLHGCEINGFFEDMRIPKYVDMNAEFFRKLERPFSKCLRVKLHLGRFIGKKNRQIDYLSSEGQQTIADMKGEIVS